MFISDNEAINIFKFVGATIPLSYPVHVQDFDPQKVFARSFRDGDVVACILMHLLMGQGIQISHIEKGIAL